MCGFFSMITSLFIYNSFYSHSTESTDSETPDLLLNSVCPVDQSCLSLCDLLDCSPPGSSVQGILQARVLEWVAISSSKRSSQPRVQTHISCIAGGFFTVEPPEKLPCFNAGSFNPSEFGESAFTHYYFVPLLVTSLLFLYHLCKSTELQNKVMATK